MRRFVIAFAFIVIPVASAGAQPRRPEARQDRRELRQDQREVRKDKRQLMDDRRDARRYANLLAAFDAARASGQPAQVAAVDSRVQAAIDAEVRESGREQMQKNAEVARSQAEVRRDRGEVRRDVMRGEPVQAGDDRRDLRDDRRDARDDRRDAQVEAVQGGRVRAIAQEYAGLAGRADAPSLDRKRALLVELNQLAGAELRQDHRELREDRRERREDRRELREDRRQGH